ncbi:MAG: RNA polymerase, partial [Gammaproteobacteria bacterium]
MGPPAPVETRGSPTASSQTTATPTVDSRVHSPAAGAEHAAAEDQTARQTETPEMAPDTSTDGALPRRE